MNSYKGVVRCLVETLKSKRIRKNIYKRGVDYTVKKYPYMGKKKILLPDEIQSEVYNKITSNEPFMAGRFGSVELWSTAKGFFNYNYKLDVSMNTLCNNAGFFPNDKSLLKAYSNLMVESMRVCDVHGIWYLPFEKYFTSKSMPSNTLLTEGRYLEPWFSKKPWTKALAGKKVLVIHPFAASIEKQYKNNRDKLFDNQDILPEFELKTIKAVQSIAGNVDERFKDWFEALNFMYEQALNIDFDVALLGCGAYGYPLAAMLKKAGKQAIHLGGVTQILFGIKGKRWETSEPNIISQMFNEFWCKPSAEEVPKNKDKVEQGCYW